jgi:hypothetical protein
MLTFFASDSTEAIVRKRKKQRRNGQPGSEQEGRKGSLCYVSRSLSNVRWRRSSSMSGLLGHKPAWLQEALENDRKAAANESSSSASMAVLSTEKRKLGYSEI